MVVFTCNNCGETLQKPRVAKHYQFQCRTAPFLTCVDCFKDFRGEEYVAHTKCITEAERYGGKDYVPKAGAQKGERKQKEWLNVVNNLLNSTTALSNAERGFLNTLSKYENIPRKKAKFLNFVRSALGYRTNMTVVESVWNKMETAHKNALSKMTDTQEQNGKVKEDHSGTNTNQHEENNITDNQNNENIEKESEEGQQNKNHGIMNGHNNEEKEPSTKKQKKSKKRTVAEITEEQPEQCDPKKKKQKAFVLLESTVNQPEDNAEKTGFDWKSTILSIVQNKGELSLKKLQKKVISQYMSYCSDTVSYEKATSKFNKKLKKVPEVIVSEERVKLA